jgi:hypothetical protein
MSGQHVTRRLSGAAIELLLVGTLALAVGKDVSEAQAKCNTAFGCAHPCVNVGVGSTKRNELQKRFTAGTRPAVCGEQLTWDNPNCPGDPDQEGAITCPSNCCK